VLDRLPARVILGFVTKLETIAAAPLPSEAAMLKRGSR
jgi:hypothetical protein